MKPLSSNRITHKTNCTEEGTLELGTLSTE